MKNIILASSSPRRIEMMKNNGYEPQIIPSRIKESIPMDMTPESSAMYLAMQKALDVNAKKSSDTPSLIIAADTIVVNNNKIIGKPKNEIDGFLILSALRNKAHHVITGVCIIDTETQVKTCFYEKTAVYFKDYSDDELTAYLKTDEPYDKAGGYAIQGTFAKYIDHFEGDYDNVVGFPWSKIKTYL